ISPTGLGGYIQILLLPFSTMRNEPVLCAVPGQKLTACYRLVQTWQIRFQRLFHGSYHHFYQSFSFHLLPLRMLADQWRHFVYTHLSGLLKKPFQPFNILGRRNGNVQVVLSFTIAGLNVGNLQHCPLRMSVSNDGRIETSPAVHKLQLVAHGHPQHAYCMFALLLAQQEGTQMWLDMRAIETLQRCSWFIVIRLPRLPAYRSVPVSQTRYSAGSFS